jgi:membrane-associated protein
VIELAATFEEQFASIAPIFVYLLAGGIIFAQTAFLPAFFLPGSSIPFSAGLVASTSKDVSIFNVAIVIFLAAAIGNQVGFALGRKIGRPLLDKFKDPRILKVVARSEIFYKRNGWWSVFAARFIPWVRTFVPTIAGASKMNYYSFSSANVIGALVWGVGITLAGYYTATLPWVETWTYSIAGFTIIASITYALVDYLRHRQQRPHTS